MYLYKYDIHTYYTNIRILSVGWMTTITVAFSYNNNVILSAVSPTLKSVCTRKLFDRGILCEVRGNRRVGVWYLCQVVK